MFILSSFPLASCSFRFWFLVKFEKNLIIPSTILSHSLFFPLIPNWCIWLSNVSNFFPVKSQIINNSDLQAIWSVTCFFFLKNFNSSKIPLYHLNDFYVYSSVILNEYTLLCNNHHHLTSELFLSWKTGILYTLDNSRPFPLPLFLSNQNSTFLSL